MFALADVRLMGREEATGRVVERIERAEEEEREEEKRAAGGTLLVRPVEDRERLTPARPGLFVAAARVREEHGRGFPQERGRRSGDGCHGRARRAREKGRERIGESWG